MIGPNSKKFLRVDLPPGVTDISSLLTLINNPQQYKSYINEIVELTKKANDTIETLCKAEEVESLLADAKAKHAEVSGKIEDASSRAMSIINEATSRATEIVTAAKSEADKRDTESAELLKSNREESVAVAEGKAWNKSQAEALDQLEASLSVREAKVSSDEIEIARKKELLSKL